MRLGHTARPHRERFSSGLTCGEPWPFWAPKLSCPLFSPMEPNWLERFNPRPWRKILWDSSTCHRQNPLHQPLPLRVRAAPNAEPVVQSVVQIRAGFEYLTLRCTSCGLVHDAQVQTDPLKSDARGWIGSELVPPK